LFAWDRCCREMEKFIGPPGRSWRGRKSSYRRETAKKLGGDDHNPAEQPSTLVKGPENVLLIHFSILFIRMYVSIPFDSKQCLTIYFVK
jgi:hypothetical protein